MTIHTSLITRAADACRRIDLPLGCSRLSRDPETRPAREAYRQAVGDLQAIGVQAYEAGLGSLRARESYEATLREYSQQYVFDGGNGVAQALAEELGRSAAGEA